MTKPRSHHSRPADPREVIGRSTCASLAFDQEGRITACNDALLDLLRFSRAALSEGSVDEDLSWRESAGNRFTFDGIRRMVLNGEVIRPFRADVATAKGEFLRVLVTPSIFLGPGPRNFEVLLQLQPERRRRSSDQATETTPFSTTPSDEVRLRVRAAALGRLTAREIQVLKSLADGSRTAEIAENLGITVGTVRNHVQSVLKKLEASSRTEAVGIALRSRLI